MLPKNAFRNSQKSSGLADLFSLSDQANTISFSGGYPDAALFPKKELQKAFQKRLTTAAPDLFQYRSVLGDLNLRQKLANYAQSLQIECSTEQIMFTQGGQQAIKLLASLFLNAGDGLAVEGPTYVGAIAAFNEYQPTYYEIPMEADGMNLDVLEEQLQTHQIKLIYTIPNFQNPTGYCMSIAKRKRLAQLAADYNALIIEDDPYRELRYAGQAMPPIKAFDKTGNVALIGSFSKILSPALRTGWVIAKRSIINDLANLRLAFDCQSPNVVLEAIDQYLTDNSLTDHIQQLRRSYQQKLATMLACLQKYLPDECHFSKPQGGFFVWVTLPAGLDAQKLLQLSKKVTFLPGSSMFVNSHEENHLRLNFTGVSLDEIQYGCQELGNLMRTALLTVQN
ncbi:MAG: PLP-dependent aminotransferase family protein [Liquorilactobacillus ghanensis]|uniref:aminotransferase-like domain-containing protein n=1 Tax=Liquorilactobacillus ghanensis TaxID=399370 RepID=UPI0039E98807